MATFHVYAGGDRALRVSRVRTIGFADLRRALADGWRDFLSMRSDLLLVGLIYPAFGLALALWSAGFNVLYLAYPAMAGLALLGPIAAIGLYEISRRREAGESVKARDAFGVLNSPALASVVALAVILGIVFVAWVGTAQALYQSLIGPRPPASIAEMFSDIFASPNGWALVVLGNAIGFLFAAIAFCATVVAFPLLLDRDVGIAEAVRASFDAVLQNPQVMAAWALVIAIGLAIGFATLFVGFAVVMPVLGHTTWRLYRALVPKVG